MRRFAAIALLLIALPSSADFIRFDPPAPDSADSISMRVAGLWSLGCRPGNPHVNVGQGVIEVRLDVIGLCAHMLPAFQEYSVEVPIGSVSAGHYEVVVEAFEGATRFEIGRRELVVAEAPPVIGGSRIEISPRVVSPGQPIVIRADGIACPPNLSPCGSNAVVLFNGGLGQIQTISSDEILVVPPPLHAGQIVDLQIHGYQGWDATVRMALRVLDPAGDFDPALFEPVLIPVIHNGPGAFGSQWKTEIWIRNESSAVIPLLGHVSLQAHETRQLGVQSAPRGYFLDVARGSVEDVSINAAFRDTTQQERSLGEEMPVVRESEFVTGPQSLLNIPSENRFRTRIRAYGFASSESSLSPTLPYAIYALLGIQPLAQGSIGLASADGAGPAFGEVPDVNALHPQIAGQGPFRIEFGPMRGGGDDRYWVMASVTNNETQHVTLITPR